MICPYRRSIPPSEGRRGTIAACGKCGACLYNRRVAWTFRLTEEARSHLSTYFLTLTYNEQNVPWTEYGKHSLYKKDVQDFLKRLRKYAQKMGYDKMRYYSLGEYGTGTDRPHYHILLFGMHPDIIHQLPALWQLGYIYCDPVNPARIHYITKYHVNKYDPHHMGHGIREESFSTMSLKPGIGMNYIERMGDWHRKHGKTHADLNGFKVPLPKSFREKIWPDPWEREQLALKNQAESNTAYRKEFKRLEKLGIEMVSSYIIKSRILEANKAAKQAKSGLTL